MESNPNPTNPTDPTNPASNGQAERSAGQTQPSASQQTPYVQPQPGQYRQTSDAANPYTQPAGQYGPTGPAGQPSQSGPYAPGQPNPYQQPYQPGGQYGQQPHGAQGRPNVDFEQLKSQAKTQAANLSRQATNLSEQMESKKLTVSGHTFSYVTLITFAGALLTVVASALPFASVKVPFFGEQSASLFEGGDGWLFLILAVAAAVLAFLKKTLPALISSGVAIVLAFYELIHSSSKLSDYGDYGVKASLGVGAILLLVGVLAMGAGTLASFLLERKARQNGSGSAAVPPASANAGAPQTPFGQPPFGQPTGQPFVSQPGQPTGQPFGQSQPVAQPFSQPQQSGQPFSQQPAQPPFGQFQSSGQPQPGVFQPSSAPQQTVPSQQPGYPTQSEYPAQPIQSTGQYPAQQSVQYPVTPAQADGAVPAASSKTDDAGQSGTASA
ncbi:hypothetical protein [Bifidobacterium aerophilum]|uniref:Large tegument protein n=1 Tax=Bifidobacterium aerophilum TaxID=1798155 RepID=A0A6N9Z4Y1_9BIFI|nr:hypothetical protein [Bifidobacterium aerophilum]NEG89682.1 hypothetical protein [Bifidobacterium aerophilum]